MNGKKAAREGEVSRDLDARVENDLLIHKNLTFRGFCLASKQLHCLVFCVVCWAEDHSLSVTAELTYTFRSSHRLPYHLHQRGKAGYTVDASTFTKHLCVLDLGSPAMGPRLCLPGSGKHSRIIALLSEGLGGPGGFLFIVDSRENCT